MARNLADLDRELARLIAERIRMLAGTEGGEAGLPRASFAPEGVPGAIWRGVLDGTAAAAAETRPKTMADP